MPLMQSPYDGIEDYDRANIVVIYETAALAEQMRQEVIAKFGKEYNSWLATKEPFADVVRDGNKIYFMFRYKGIDANCRRK